MSWNVSGTSERDIKATAAAVASIRLAPPRRRASSTTPITHAALASAMVSAMAAGLMWAGMASSQYNIGPGL